LLTEDQLDKTTPSAPEPSQDKGLHVVRRLRRAFLAICRCGDVVFSPYRLTTEQFALMRSVMLEPGIRQTELTNRIVAEPNTVTAMVTLLEKRGIVRRKPSPTDRRVRQLYLTPHGQAVMHRLQTEWKPMRQVLRNHFESEEGRRALDILDEVAVIMQLEREKLMQTMNDSALGIEEIDAGLGAATQEDDRLPARRSRSGATRSRARQPKTS
jgi:DNA-binding MarR family transcriptional regulator